MKCSSHPRCLNLALMECFTALAGGVLPHMDAKSLDLVKIEVGGEGLDENTTVLTFAVDGDKTATVTPTVSPGLPTVSKTDSPVVKETMDSNTDSPVVKETMDNSDVSQESGERNLSIGTLNRNDAEVMGQYKQETSAKASSPNDTADGLVKAYTFAEDEYVEWSNKEVRYSMPGNVAQVCARLVKEVGPLNVPYMATEDNAYFAVGIGVVSYDENEKALAFSPGKQCASLVDFKITESSGMVAFLGRELEGYNLTDRHNRRLYTI